MPHQGYSTGLVRVSDASNPSALLVPVTSMLMSEKSCCAGEGLDDVEWRARLVDYKWRGACLGMSGSERGGAGQRKEGTRAKRGERSRDRWMMLALGDG